MTRGRRPPGDPKKPWTIENVYRLLCAPLHLFLGQADPARLDASVPAFISNLSKPPGSSPGAVYGSGPPPPDEAGVLPENSSGAIVLRLARLIRY